jgi:hydroxyethylthiazole kinase-like sugar kinase family protein
MLDVGLMAFSVIELMELTKLWDGLLVNAFEWEEEVWSAIRAAMSIRYENQEPLMADDQHRERV